jgi:tight adherence protein C
MSTAAAGLAMASWFAAVVTLAPHLPTRRRHQVAARLASLHGLRPRGHPSAPPSDPTRRRGWARVRAAGIAAAAVAMIVVAGPLAAGAFVGGVAALVAARRVGRRRVLAARRQAALPELLDLLGTSLAAGLTIRQSIELPPSLFPDVLRDDVAGARAMLDRGARTADAVGALGAALGPPAHPVVAALTAHERDGTPLGPTLQRLADEARHQRRQRAEQAVRQLPVRLSFPLVCCTLSSFVLLTVAPLAIATLRSLQPVVP